MSKNIVLTGGKFNHIHPGHVWLLKKAKKLGKLVVIIANDKRNTRSYALPAKQRRKNLAKLGIADAIAIGGVKDCLAVVKKYHPNMIILGYDQSLPPGTEDYIRKHRVAIIRFRKYGSHSTRKLVR